MAKRRAAFLLKQQRKAEETRLRKQQLEAESELKRDEARYGRQLTVTESERRLGSPFFNALLQGARPRRTASARKRRKHGESSLNKSTCEGSSKR